MGKNRPGAPEISLVGFPEAEPGSQEVLVFSPVHDAATEQSVSEVPRPSPVSPQGFHSSSSVLSLHSSKSLLKVLLDFLIKIC